jgi:hypothetical protein
MARLLSSPSGVSMVQPVRRPNVDTDRLVVVSSPCVFPTVSKRLNGTLTEQSSYSFSEPFNSAVVKESNVCVWSFTRFKYSFLVASSSSSVIGAHVASESSLLVSLVFAIDRTDDKTLWFLVAFFVGGPSGNDAVGFRFDILASIFDLLLFVACFDLLRLLLASICYFCCFDLLLFVAKKGVSLFFLYI